MRNERKKGSDAGKDRIPVHVFSHIICAALIFLALGGLSVQVYAQDDLADRIRAAQTSGNYAEAARLYRQLIAEGSDTPEIRSNFGIVLHLAGKNREALEQFRIALTRNPALASANLFAGLSEVELGDPKSALSYLKKAEELDPARPAPLLALGKAYVALRDYGQANGAYTKATTLDSSLAEAWYGVGVTDRSLAEEILNEAARSGSIKDAAKLKVQHLLDGARDALSRAVQLEPNSARTHFIMAESLSDAGNLVKAVPEYRTALKLDPELDAAYLGLATSYWKQREFDQARPLLKRVLEKSPKNAEAAGMMADILQQTGDIQGAEHYVEIALAGNPDLIDTRVVLARIHLAKQQPRLAIADLSKVISADRDGRYHFLLYQAYRQAGDQQSAQQALAESQRLRYKPPSE
ncbi:MAG: tetratricopeptide repeat protein [Bryobacteraceae bacterium]